MTATEDAAPRKRGRPPKSTPAPLPENPANWISPEKAARHLDVSAATLWRGVQDGTITPPSYPAPKAPRFNLRTLDADMIRARSKPADAEGARRLAEARAFARQHRAAGPVARKADGSAVPA